MDEPAPGAAAPSTPDAGAPLDAALAPSPRRPSPWKRALRIGAPLLVLALVVLFVDVGEVVAAIRSLPTTVAVLGVSLLLVDRLLMALKWWSLLRGADAPMPLRETWDVYNQTGFLNLVLPTVVASEVLRVYRGQRLGIPTGTLVGSMALERLIGIVSATLLATAGTVYIAADLTPTLRQEVEALVALCVALSLGALGVFAWQPAHRWVGDRLRSVLPNRVHGIVKALGASLRSYRARPRLLVANLLLAMVEHLTLFTVTVLVLRGLGVDVPVLTLYALVSVVSMVQRTVAHLESRALAELGGVMIYELFGVPREVAIANAFLNYALFVVATLPGAWSLARAGATPWRRPSDASTRGAAVPIPATPVPAPVPAPATAQGG